MQGLLDPSDASLDFVMKRDNVRPIAIYRIEEDFLLCYDGTSLGTHRDLADNQNSLSTSTRMDGGLDRNGPSSGRVYLLLLASSSISRLDTETHYQHCNTPMSLRSNRHSSKSGMSRQEP